MEINKKDMIRIACIIREQICQLAPKRGQEVQRLIHVVTDYLAQMKLLHRGLDKCIKHQWHYAARELTNRLCSTLRDLPYALDELDRMVQSSESSVPTLREIYEELLQLHEEFGKVDYDAEQKSVAVFTDPIELEDVYLGDFELRLDITKLAEIKNAHYLRVIALDPHPASTNESVTHPHVSDEYLCMGDANIPMQQAIINGRICDFFLLAKAVLENYNRSSPYVALSDWNGISCYDCGYTACEDETYYCEQCENTFCSECMGYCDCCHNSFCQGCMTECPVCEEQRCGDCMEKCSQCGEPVCKSCIDETLCPSCKEESENENESETEPTESESTESITNNQQVA